VEMTPRYRAQILQSIKQFLEDGFPPATPRQCRRCGSSMQAVDVDFLVSGTEINWKVSLPFCPVCDKAVLDDMHRPETIH
jgi:hypothetical protein